MLVEGRYGNDKLHEHILHKCLFPFLEKVVANCNSGKVYSISREMKVYLNGSVAINPDALIQTLDKDLVFEVKSSREEGAWIGGLKQCKKCFGHYSEQFKDFNYYMVRPAERATSITNMGNLEIGLVHSQGDELEIEEMIPVLE